MTKICPECREVTAKAIDRVAGNTKDYDYYDYLVRRGAERISALVRALPAREPGTDERVREIANRLDAMLLQVWHPDYSLRELCEGIRRAAQELRALKEERGE